MNDELIKKVLNTLKSHADPANELLEDYRRRYTSSLATPGTRSPGMLSATVGIDGPTGEDANAPITDTNYAFAFLDTFTANITPNNPEVTCSINNNSASKMATDRSKFLNWWLDQAKFREVLWQLANRAGLYGLGWLHFYWDDVTKDVRTEVVDTRLIWFDYTPARFEDMRFVVRLRLIDEDVYTEKITAFAKKNKTQTDLTRTNIHGWPSWLKYTDTAKQLDTLDSVLPLVFVYEFHDFRTGKIHWYNDSMELVLTTKNPYTHVKNSFVPLRFVENLKDLRGTSFLQLIAASLDRLLELDNLALWFVLANIPKPMVNASLLSDPDAFVSALNATTDPSKAVKLEMINQSVDPEKVIIWSKAPALQPDFRAQRAQLHEGIEYVLGVSSFSRGVLGQTDIATEAALADASQRTRNARYVADIFTVIITSSRIVMGLYKQFSAKSGDVFTRANQKLDTDFGRLGGTELFGNEKEEEFFYEVSAFSPTENNRVALLQQLNAHWQRLFNNPSVDQAKLTETLLRLLTFDYLFVEAAPPVAGIPGSPAPNGAVGGPMDLMALLGKGKPEIDKLGLGQLSAGDLPPGTTEPQPITSGMAGGAGVPNAGV